jgi:hypothetical protein
VFTVNGKTIKSIEHRGVGLQQETTRQMRERSSAFKTGSASPNSQLTSRLNNLDFTERILNLVVVHRTPGPT